jgi:hypothetical protein
MEPTQDCFSLGLFDAESGLTANDLEVEQIVYLQTQKSFYQIQRVCREIGLVIANQI